MTSPPSGPETFLASRPLAPSITSNNTSSPSAKELELPALIDE